MDFCTSCGQPLKEGAGFCSNCGAARAAAEGPAAPSAPAAPDAAATAPTAPIEGAPFAPAAPMPPQTEPAKDKNGRALLLASCALVVVAALVVGLLFVFGVFKDNKGASSPEAAVSDLLSSTVALNPSRALTVFAPGEVDGFAAFLKTAHSPEVTKAATKFCKDMDSQFMAFLDQLPGGVGSKVGSMAGNCSSDDMKALVKATSVKVTHLQYKTTNLADGLADVAITGGDVTISVDASKIPSNLRDLVKMSIEGRSDVPSWVTQLTEGKSVVSKTWKISDLASTAAAVGQKLDVMVVKQNGGWFLSLYGTIAQHVYEGVSYDRVRNGSSALEQPDWKLYANPPKAIVASSPEQVPANLAKAFNHQSVMEIFQNLPQNEVRALYPYVPLLQKAADSSDGSSGSPNISVSNVKSTTTGTEGDQVHVIYTQMSATSTSDGTPETISVNNGCYSDGGKPQCVRDWPDFGKTLAAVFGIDKGVPITLRKVSGGYQLDPVGSVLGVATSAVTHLDGLSTAFKQFMDYVTQQFKTEYGSASGTSSSNCYDSSGNYTC